MAGYTCPTCKRISKIPDFCCGQSMKSRGSFYCSTCQNNAVTSGNCCGQTMSKL